MPSRYYFFVSVSPGAGTSKSFERSRAGRSGLQDSIAPAFTAPIAFHFGAELVERHGAEHRDPLAEHPERHPQSALAALASDPRVTLGFELGDGAGVCHAALKRGTAGSATHMPAGSCGFLKSMPGLVALMVVADGFRFLGFHRKGSYRDTCWKHGNCLYRPSRLCRSRSF
jgi:hypothetical protein